MGALRVPIDGLRVGQLVLDREASNYVARVHRVRPGESVVLFDPAQCVEAFAEVIAIERGHVTCSVGHLQTAQRVARVPLWLVVGLCKPEPFSLLIREASALGVTDFVPLETRFSDVHGKRAVRPERWQKLAVEGARQSGRGDVMKIHELGVVSDVGALIPVSAGRVCLWEGGGKPILRVLDELMNPVGLAVAVGPQGGFADVEVQELRRQGFVLTSLGEMILRTETAAIAACGSCVAWTESHR